MGFRRELAKRRPTTTDPETAWQPDFFGQYDIGLVNACNTGDEDAEISIYHDPTGTTYTEDTALVWKFTLRPGDVLQLFGDISDYRKEGSIGVESSVPDIVLFKIYGEIADEVIAP